MTTPAMTVNVSDRVTQLRNGNSPQVTPWRSTTTETIIDPRPADNITLNDAERGGVPMVTTPKTPSSLPAGGGQGHLTPPHSDAGPAGPKQPPSRGRMPGPMQGRSVPGPPAGQEEGMRKNSPAGSGESTASVSPLYSTQSSLPNSFHPTTSKIPIVNALHTTPKKGMTEPSVEVDQPCPTGGWSPSPPPGQRPRPPKPSGRPVPPGGLPPPGGFLPAGIPGGPGPSKRGHIPPRKKGCGATPPGRRAPPTMKVPNGNVFKAQIKDIMLWLLLSLVGIGVLLVITTMVCVKVLDARKRRGQRHCCNCCYIFCENQSNSQSRRTSRVSVTGTNVNVNVQVELRMNDLHPTDSVSSEEGSSDMGENGDEALSNNPHHSAQLAGRRGVTVLRVESARQEHDHLGRERTYSTETNRSDPPSYNEAILSSMMGLGVHTISAQLADGVAQPPPYEEVVSTGLSLPS